MASVRLINNTKGVAKKGYVVKLDPRNPDAFIYASSGDTSALGVIGTTAAYRQHCEIITGGTALVYVQEMVVIGSKIRLGKSTDRISLGACKLIKETDAPYIKIGTAMETGKGLIKCNLELSYVFSDVDEIDFDEIGNPNTRIVTDTTTELTTDYTIICNKATAMTVNLLAATGSRRIREISSIGVGVVTVEGNGGDTIDDELNQEVNQWDTMVIQDYITGKWKIK